MRNKKADDLCRSYFQAIRINSPSAHALYEQVGKGDLKAGYDIVSDRINEHIEWLIEFYYRYTDKPNGISIHKINKELCSELPELYTTQASPYMTIWRRIFRDDGFKSYTALYRLDKTVEALKKIEEELENE